MVEKLENSWQKHLDHQTSQVALVVKNIPADAGDLETRVQPLDQEDSPGGGNGNPTQVFLSGESHGQRSLAGYRPQGRTKLDTTEATQQQCW